MDLDRKFQDVTSFQSVKISSLDVNRIYPITPAERIVTKFWPIVLMSVRNAPFYTVKAFMPKLYGLVFSYADIEDINTEKVLLHLIYKETFDNNKSHTLAIKK
jgi:hypothetical protein